MTLPTGYTQVEYIESTGTQWIDTGVAGSNNACFEIDFLTKNVVGPASTDFGTIFGAYTAGSTRINLGTWNSSQVTTGGEMCWGSGNFNPYITSNERMQISVKSTTLTTPNGTQSVGSQTFTSGCNIWLFCRNANGTADQFSKTQLYSMKMYNGSTLIRDFVPCKNASGQVGLYDTVNGKFYGNNGTGAFVAGTEIKPLAKSSVNIGGSVRTISEGYANIGGVIVRLVEGYTNIGGVVYRTWYREPTPKEIQIGTLAVGSVVKIPVGGVTYEWIVVHQGLPSSTYDASCNGTWLLMKTVYSSATHSGYVMSSFDSTDSDYANSDANAWLNGTFFNLIDSSVRSLIKQVKIPYRPGTSGGSVNSGSNGLSAKIFFLSATELGFTEGYIGSIGSKLDYFQSTNNNSELRIAKNLSGGTMNWYTRSPYTYNTTNAISINTSGGLLNGAVDTARAFRPAFILPPTTLVDTDMNVLA